MGLLCGVTLSGVRFFAPLRMTQGEGPIMTDKQDITPWISCQSGEGGR
jgi:hypothetical protein